MAESPPYRNLSLVPYAQNESREIVLRHGSSVVVFDPRSKQLSLRDASRSASVELSDCPYCHRPLRESSPEHDQDETPMSPTDGSTFAHPAYFRMLHHSNPGSSEPSRPPSPHKRIGQPGLRDTGASLQTPVGAEFVGSAPTASSTHGISSNAFSQNYFKTFFVEEKVLGRGGKGVVLLVKHILDGVSLGHFACKRVPVGDDHEWLEKVLVEVQLLQNLSHQNLVSYRHVWLEDYQINTFGPSVPCAFILQQYCNAGDLHHYILESNHTTPTNEQLKERMRRRSKGQLEIPTDLGGPRRLPFEEIFSFFRDITSGLHHLHSNGYIHRDLKPSNCLLHTTGNKTRVLVSDFGEVQVVNMARKSTGSTGTISYCAPEVLKRENPGGAFGNFTTKSDIFSLGMIVYFMCFGRLPYSQADNINEEKEDLDQLREEITAWVGFNDDRRVRTDLPDRLYRFLKRLLSLDPNERPGTEDILHGIKAGANLDDISGFASSPFFEPVEPRIRPAESPAPSPPRPTQGRKHSGGFIGPGPSNLRHTYAEHHRSPSPKKVNHVRNPSGGKPSNVAESSVVLRPRKADFQSRSSPTPPAPRLMLPPPPTLRSRVLHFLASPAVVSSGRLALFLIKVFSVQRPCSPLAANPWAAYPLFMIAAFDLISTSVLRGHASFRFSSALFLGVHLLVVAATLRWDSLCLKKVAIMG